MSDVTTTEIALSPQQEQELTEKQKNWGMLVEQMYRREISIQNQAKNQIDKLKLPTCIEQVPAAETQLKELNQAQSSIQKQRMEITSTFDKVATRLMIPEKSLDAPKKQLTEAILKVKTEYEKIQQAKRNKEAEVQTVIANIKNYITNKDVEFRGRINRTCAGTFKAALDGGIQPGDQLQDYLKERMMDLGAADFQAERPNLTLRFITPEEAEELLNTHLLCNPHAYVKIYQEELAAKFVDYAVAFTQKEEALKQAEVEARQAQDRLLLEKQQRDLATNLESRAQPMEPRIAVSAVKRVYEVDMPDNLDSAIQIIAAFIANRNLCEHHLRTKKFLEGFTASSAGKALAAAKNQDNAFQPQGIHFKEVAKL